MTVSCTTDKKQDRSIPRRGSCDNQNPVVSRTLYKARSGGALSIIPELRKRRQEDQEFKVILNHIVSSKSAQVGL